MRQNVLVQIVLMFVCHTVERFCDRHEEWMKTEEFVRVKSHQREESLQGNFEIHLELNMLSMQGKGRTIRKVKVGIGGLGSFLLAYCF